MLCENCGKNNANVKYTQIINGVKKEMNVCEKCAKELGIGGFNFNMPIDFSSFFGNIFADYEASNFLPTFTKVKEKKCENCGETYNEFIKTGLFGCQQCFDTFSDPIDDLLKKIQGSNRHIGRKGINGKISENNNKKEIKKPLNDEKQLKESKKILKLQEDLKNAIKDERYEDAAKIRDEIKLIIGE